MELTPLVSEYLKALYEDNKLLKRNVYGGCPSCGPDYEDECVVCGVEEGIWRDDFPHREGCSVPLIIKQIQEMEAQQNP